MFMQSFKILSRNLPDQYDKCDRCSVFAYNLVRDIDHDQVSFPRHQPCFVQGGPTVEVKSNDDISGIPEYMTGLLAPFSSSALAI